MEIAAGAMAGTGVAMEPLLPQRAAREGVELSSGGALRKPRHGQRDVALENPGEAVAHFVIRLADRDRPGDIGGAVEILRTRIEELRHPRLDPLFAVRGRPVMHDRAVRPGPRDRRKAQVAEILAGAAEAFELVAGGDLGQFAGRRRARQPGEKAGQRGAVAAMRGAGAVELDRVLAGLR